MGCRMVEPWPKSDYQPCPVRGCRAVIQIRLRSLCLGHEAQLPRDTRRQLDILRERRKRSPRHTALYVQAVGNAARLACPQRYGGRWERRYGAPRAQLRLW